ncbi:protein serine/threonine phosphatase [Candidatus Protofrankia datiscae]|uniref:Protein serine/threonine phosphatase n=3 Tax=Frankiaceae TaxID=74712 RepID=F8AZD0_9ACTN|nr:PP2C family serine/threonine-protein phosphatase [Candidatus Protofrankia datiscae]AEH11662.1 protein serine/threonine phosphatase [Candidatus Protofrankia datiscae]
MDSPVVPITLIVVLLIGAILFVVLSSRNQDRPGPGSGSRSRRSSPDASVPVRRPPQRRRRRQRQGILATLRRPAAAREQAGGADPDGPAGPPPRASTSPPAAPAQVDGSTLPGDAAAPTEPVPTAPAPPAPPAAPVPSASVRASPAEAATTAYPTPPPYRTPVSGTRPDSSVDPAATTRVTPLVNATADTTVRVESDRRQQSRGPDATGWMPPLVGPPPPVIPAPESGRARPAADQFAAGGPTQDGDPSAGTAGHDTLGSSPGAGAGSSAGTQAGRYSDDRPGAASPRDGGPDTPRDNRGTPTGGGWTLPPTAPIPPPGPPSAPGGEQLVANEPDVSTSAPLRLAAAGRTRRGKRGGPNEDAFVVVDGLLAVADGVGGEAAGQIASTLAVTTVASFRPQYAADPRDGLRGALERANRTVREKPREEPSWHGMACALDVVVLGRQQDTGRTLFVAHVGDSSVWLQPGRGRPRRLTTPHAIKNGPLLNAIGLNEEVELDLLEEPVRAGDRVVLASDGITKVMTPEQLDGLLMELGSLSPERAADTLVDAAMIAGARDDTTIVVADLVADDASTR